MRLTYTYLPDIVQDPTPDYGEYIAKQGQKELVWWFGESGYKLLEEWVMVARKVAGDANDATGDKG